MWYIQSTQTEEKVGKANLGTQSKKKKKSEKTLNLQIMLIGTVLMSQEKLIDTF